MGGGKDKHKHDGSDQHDKGILSNIAHGLSGYPPGQHSGYPPQGHQPHGYPPQGYPPAPGGYPQQGYPPQHGGYPPQHGGYPPQGYPPAGYPPHSQGHGSHAGSLLAGGAAAAAAAYGVHHLTHGSSHHGGHNPYGMIHMAIMGVMGDIVHMVILVGSSSIMVASSNIMENSSMGSMESMECSAVASLGSGSDYSNMIFILTT